MKINESPKCTGIHFNEGCIRYKYLPCLIVNCHGFVYYFSIWWLKLRVYKLKAEQRAKLKGVSNG